MNRLTIKMRLTLWYAFFMIMLLFFAFGFLYYLSKNAIQTTTKNQLREVVIDALEDLEYDDGVLEYDDIDFFKRGVYLIVYADDNREQMLYNYLSSDLQLDFDLKLDTFHEKNMNGEQFYVYDNAIIVEGYGKVWIRGITSFSDAQVFIGNILRWSAIMFPIIVFLIIIFGYRIVKKAFSPINQMINVANNIKKGQDLTKRIDLNSDDKGEIHQLSIIFDDMFERLQASFENEQQFIFDASHELKTPIAVIISHCEYILEKSTLPLEEIEGIKVVLDQGKKMSRLISQLLMLSKSEYELQIEKINISSLLLVIAEEQQILASKKNILIKTNIEEDIFIEADETMLIRLFINLISNAITYGKEAGVVSLILKSQDGKLYAEVNDNGIGIKEEHLDKIWNRFYQVETSRTANKESGMGLGLSMVKWIIEKHNGTIKIDSEWEKGTKIYFHIPLIFL